MNTLFNLPKKVIFCKKCLMSNQRPASIPEFKHVKSREGAKYLNIDSSTGELKYLSPPDFENPLDADFNNVYTIEVNAMDNGAIPLSDLQILTIFISDVDEIEPQPYIESTIDSLQYTNYSSIPMEVTFQEPVFGFDINDQRINQLQSGEDVTLETNSDDLKMINKNRFTSDINDIKESNIYIVTVPIVSTNFTSNL